MLRVLALDLEGVFQRLAADVAQFHQQAADAHGKMILADSRLDLLVGDQFELFEDIQQAAGFFQLGLDPLGIDHLVFLEVPGLQEHVPISVYWGPAGAGGTCAPVDSASAGIGRAFASMATLSGPAANGRDEKIDLCANAQSVGTLSL